MAAAGGVYQPTFFSLRGPAKVLNQPAYEARVMCGEVRLGGMGREYLHLIILDQGN